MCLPDDEEKAKRDAGKWWKPWVSQPGGEQKSCRKRHKVTTRGCALIYPCSPFMKWKTTAVITSLRVTRRRKKRRLQKKKKKMSPQRRNRLST